MKHDQKGFIRIPLLNIPKTRPLDTFLSSLLNGYHGNDDRYKNFNFSFGYVFPRSMTVQSFITIKWQEKKLSMIKLLNFLVLTNLIHSTANAIISVNKAVASS